VAILFTKVRSPDFDQLLNLCRVVVVDLNDVHVRHLNQLHDLRHLKVLRNEHLHRVKYVLSSVEDLRRIGALAHSRTSGGKQCCRQDGHPKSHLFPVHCCFFLTSDLTTG